MGDEGKLWPQEFQDLTRTQVKVNLGRAIKLLRGGSWNNNPRHCPSADRHNNPRDNRNNIDFRVSIFLTFLPFGNGVREKMKTQEHHG